VGAATVFNVNPLNVYYYQFNNSLKLEEIEMTCTGQMAKRNQKILIFQRCEMDNWNSSTIYLYNFQQHI
jgi:hypothetical protein